MASDLQGCKVAVLEGAVIVGIDVAKENHWARLIERLGQDLLPPFGIHNTQDGFGRAVANMEATGHYRKPLWYFRHATCGARSR